MQVQRNDIDVRTGYMITNGYPHFETLKDLDDDGLDVINVVKAKRFHPYATDSDYIIFYAKPINKEKYDDYMKQFKEQFVENMGE